jgi:hypothetical protein
MMALGWLVVTLDMPLYMILEGRAFWPVFLKRAAIRRQLNRLRRIERDTIAAFGRFNRTRAQEDERAYQELGVLLREYPMDKDGHYIAPFPTRLGNLIHAFETYPDVRYGADAVFYWPRLLMKMDKDAREDLDTRQALPDSAVYASVALLITGVLWTGYAAGKIFSRLVAARWPELTAAASPFAIPLPSATACCMVALISYVCAAIVYRASLYTNSQYGEVFRLVHATIESRLHRCLGHRRAGSVGDAGHRTHGGAPPTPLRSSVAILTQLPSAMSSLHVVV